MPLYILVPMILIGLPVVIILVYWTTRDRRSDPLNPQTVEKRFTRDFAGFRSSSVIISDSGNSAFLVSKDSDEVGLLYAVGKNYLTRLLDRNAIRKIEETKSGIDLYVNDFTLGKISVPLSDIETRQSMVKRLHGGK
ncbi:MAG: hypothetical protein AAF423_11925 [Pseudomonadota bacterium]